MTDETPVVRTVRLSTDAVLAQNWDLYADLLADSFRIDDRRVGMKAVTDKAAAIEMQHVIVDLGGIETIDLDFLETRRERVALYRITVRAADFVIPILAVGEVDAEGLMLITVFFDENDLGAARAEVDALAAAAE